MDAIPPSIPRHNRHPRRREWEFEGQPSTDADYRGQDQEQEQERRGPQSENRTVTGRRPHARDASVAPASPEVISSLITSLSGISRTVDDQFDFGFDPVSPKYPADPPGPRHQGSFGVTYGAGLPQSDNDAHDESNNIDEFAAAPPVIKGSRRPSGYSPITAPKSPSHREHSGSGLRSLLGGGKNTSRPSSRASSVSKDADLQSLGNISVERTTSPGSSPSEVRKTRSSDSWGKKSGRKNSRLVYTGSREFKDGHRDSEERKRSLGSSSNGLAASAMARTTGPRLDSFLAESIKEEPITFDGLFADFTPSGDGSMSPRPIPQRDSSLRKTGSNAKRSSRRSSKRESDHGPIPEEDPFNVEAARTDRNGESYKNGRSSYRAGESPKVDRPSRTERSGEGLLDPNWTTTTKANNYIDHYVTDTEAEMDDGAPAPSIAQGKARDRNVSRDRNGRRRSGRSTPELGVKRSSSRLKRLSGPLSPRVEGPKEETRVASVAYERPPSADSIDDAVEAYMNSPRLSQKIKHPQTGRVISFSEVGDPDGSAVFCCVGMGLTRYITAFYDELALTLKLRLITPDRPGVGDSEAYAEGTATPLSWPDDVYAICQALKITKFSILAHSAGAIYALATALRMPQHIRGRIHLLAPWIPPSQMSVFGASAQAPLPPTNAIPTSQKILRALPTPILKAANSSFMSATSSSITSSLPKQKKTKRKPSGKNPNMDKENQNSAKIAPDMPTLTREMVATEEMDLDRPEGASPTGPLSPTRGRFGGGGIDSGLDGRGHSEEDAIIAAAASALADKQRQESYDTRLTHAIWELATTGANPAVDLLVCLERRHTIGFRYVDITRPVVIHHGSRDTRVPVENVKWLGQMMKRCEVRVLEGEGHGLMASAVVMGGILMEISKEWEDWNQATGQTSRREGKRGGAR